MSMTGWFFSASVTAVEIWSADRAFMASSLDCLCVENNRNRGAIRLSRVRLGVARRNPRLLSRENIFQGVLGGLVRGELVRPLDPRVRIGAGAGGLELGETGGFFARRVAPVVPAGGFD